MTAPINSRKLTPRESASTTASSANISRFEVAIIVAIVFPVLCLLVVALVLWYRRRTRSRTSALPYSLKNDASLTNLITAANRPILNQPSPQEDVQRTPDADLERAPSNTPHDENPDRATNGPPLSASLTSSSQSVELPLQRTWTDNPHVPAEPRRGSARLSSAALTNRPRPLQLQNSHDAVSRNSLGLVISALTGAIIAELPSPQNSNGSANSLSPLRDYANGLSHSSSRASQFSAQPADFPVPPLRPLPLRLTPAVTTTTNRGWNNADGDVDAGATVSLLEERQTYIRIRANARGENPLFSGSSRTSQRCSTPTSIRSLFNSEPVGRAHVSSKRRPKFTKDTLPSPAFSLPTLSSRYATTTTSETILKPTTTPHAWPEHESEPSFKHPPVPGSSASNSGGSVTSIERMVERWVADAVYYKKSSSPSLSQSSRDSHGDVSRHTARPDAMPLNLRFLRQSSRYSLAKTETIRQPRYLDELRRGSESARDPEDDQFVNTIDALRVKRRSGLKRRDWEDCRSEATADDLEAAAATASSTADTAAALLPARGDDYRTGCVSPVPQSSPAAHRLVFSLPMLSRKSSETLPRY